MDGRDRACAVVNLGEVTVRTRPWPAVNQLRAIFIGFVSASTTGSGSEAAFSSSAGVGFRFLIECVVQSGMVFGNERIQVDRVAAERGVLGKRPGSRR